MIAVLADGDPNGYPFWVAKAIKVFTKNEDVTSVEVHWYATNTHPFNGVYKTQMVVDKKKWCKEKNKGYKYKSSLHKPRRMLTDLFMTSI